MTCLNFRIWRENSNFKVCKSLYLSLLSLTPQTNFANGWNDTLKKWFSLWFLSSLDSYNVNSYWNAPLVILAGSILSPFVIWHIFFWLTENVKYKLYISGNTAKARHFSISFLPYCRTQHWQFISRNLWHFQSASYESLRTTSSYQN